MESYACLSRTADVALFGVGKSEKRKTRNAVAVQFFCVRLAEHNIKKKTGKKMAKT